jgi:hypothetical protein
MKKLYFVALLNILSIVPGYAQESYGKTFNIGVGIGGYSGYYGYLGRSTPIFHVNYELSVGKNLTIAPFVTIHTRKDKYYWGNPNKPMRYYAYRETIIPIGIKLSYYFDQLLEAGDDWDFYLAGSLGYSIINTHWEDGYDGDRYYYGNPGNLYLDLHIGTEYHINSRTGVFFDLSNGVSILGFSIHPKY